jgi:hypothetical protein
MRSRKSFLAISVLLGLTLLMTACPNQESISKINADPGRYRNKDVAIAGRVTDSYGFLGRGAYEIEDGTGKMWVITERGVPSKGSRVGASGHIENGFSFGGRSFATVMLENDRRSR